MHRHVMLASGKHPAISPAIDASQIPHFAEKLALDYLSKIDLGAYEFTEPAKQAWLGHVRGLGTTNQVSVHPKGIMSGNTDMLTTTECDQSVCPFASEGKVWTEEEWKADRSGDNTFIDIMRSGQVVEIDADMYDYWLGVLPPVQMGGTLTVVSEDGTCFKRPVDFGFADGYEHIVGFWRDNTTGRFWLQCSQEINTR